MRISSLLFLPILAISTFAPSILAAPSESNSIQQILEKACVTADCAEGYRVRFKQVSFEPNKQQVTLNLTLLPNPGIDYPVLTEAFESQLVQSSFAAICKIRHVAGLELMLEGETMGSEFRASLKACLGSLTERTEKALGRN